jgi:4-aminobutyrate aminotransferase / (S)-3-amino-2-methylpropionate transaminase / 5-aminovalerate transaminase
VSIAAALATLEVIEQEGLLARARAIGERLNEVLHGLQAEFAQIGDVRGAGAMIGIEFVSDDERTPNPAVVEAIVSHARDNGLILLPTGSYGNVIRLLPPLNLSDAELAEGAEKLEGAIRHALSPVTAVA